MKMRPRHYPARRWQIPEPIELQPISTLRINWFNAEYRGQVETPDGLMEAVTLYKRELEAPAADLMGHIGKPVVASEVAAIDAPRIMFWRDAFWMVARDDRRPIEYYGRWKVRMAGDPDIKWPVHLVYQITISDVERTLASISAI